MPRKHTVRVSYPDIHGVAAEVALTNVAGTHDVACKGAFCTHTWTLPTKAAAKAKATRIRDLVRGDFSGMRVTVK